MRELQDQRGAMAAPPAHESQVQEAMNLLLREMQKAEEARSVLEDRLSPVCRSETTKEKTTEPPRPARVALAEMIIGIADRLDMLAEKTTSLISRVEL